jgi:hypothetical protein
VVLALRLAPHVRGSLSTVGATAVREETVKTHCALPLAVAIGLGFGAVAIQGLHARTTTPPVYVVVEIDEITDASGFEALRQTADATAVEVQSEDGRYFASTEKVNALDRSQGHSSSRAQCANECPVSGAKRTLGGRAADVCF